jgi:hypothetical protein
MVSVVNNILEQHGGVQGVVNQFRRTVSSDGQVLGVDGSE